MSLYCTDHILYYNDEQTHKYLMSAQLCQDGKLVHHQKSCSTTAVTFLPAVVDTFVYECI